MIKSLENYNTAGLDSVDWLKGTGLKHRTCYIFSRSNVGADTIVQFEAWVERMFIATYSEGVAITVKFQEGLCWTDFSSSDQLGILNALARHPVIFRIYID